MAEKLLGFAATEAGSALDMLKAAELCPDPKLRRLFLRHALDEARHARLFRDEALRLDPDGRARRSDYNLVHATRQNLYRRLGLEEFVAFVHLAERRGEAQFRALHKHFGNRPELERTFAGIARDERFHVGYTAEILARWRRSRPQVVARALARVRGKRLWLGWRRAGRRLGDAVARALLTVVYFTLVPPFAWLEKRFARNDGGWRWHAPRPPTLDQARRQS
jgi:rubrerythrin